jgi:hypothetical protein
MDTAEHKQLVETHWPLVDTILTRGHTDRDEERVANRRAHMWSRFITQAPTQANLVRIARNLATRSYVPTFPAVNGRHHEDVTEKLERVDFVEPTAPAPQKQIRDTIPTLRELLADMPTDLRRIAYRLADGARRVDIAAELGLSPTSISRRCDILEALLADLVR